MTTSDDKRRLRSAFPIVLLTILIDFLGLSILIPVLPIYAEELGASRFEIGAIFGLYALAQLFFIPAWGWLSDRIGRKPIILVSVAGMIAAFLMLWHVETLGMILVARFLGGMFAANISTAQTIITDLTEPEDRAKGMGLIGATIGFSFVIGPALGGYLATIHESWPALHESYPLIINEKLPFLFVAFLAGLNFINAVFLLPETKPPGKQPMDWHILVRRIVFPPPFRLMFSLLPTSIRLRILSRLPAGIRPMLIHYPARISIFLAIFLVLYSSLGAFETMFTPFLSERFALDERGAGLMLTYIGMWMIPIQGLLLGRVSRGFPERKILVVGLCLFSFSLAVIALSPSTTWLFCIGPVMALGQGLSYPIFTSIYSQNCASHQTGELMADGYAMQTTGRIIGPALGGLAADYLDIRAPFLIGGVFVFLCVFWTWSFLRRADVPAPS